MFELRLEGSSWERGIQHGEAFRKEIHELSQIRRSLIQPYLKDFSVRDTEVLAWQQFEVLREKMPDYYTEFCGIARGANLSVSDLVILNNYTDMRDFGAPNTDEGCSVFGVRSREKNISVAGQTWDMHASAAPYMLLLHIDPSNDSDEPASKILTVTGGLGLAGVNEHGVTVLINNMHCSETNSEGVLWNALVRKMLCQSTASEAFEVFKESLPCSGHNYLMADPKRVINIEATGLQWEMMDNLQEEGVSFHTNHYLGALQKFEIMKRRSKTTEARYQELDAYFRKAASDHKTLGMETLIEDIFNEKETSIVCQKTPPTAHSPATCGGIITDLNERKGIAFAGLYSEQKHLKFSF